MKSSLDDERESYRLRLVGINMSAAAIMISELTVYLCFLYEIVAQYIRAGSP